MHRYFPRAGDETLKDCQYRLGLRRRLAALCFPAHHARRYFTIDTINLFYPRVADQLVELGTDTVQLADQALDDVRGVGEGL